MSKGKENIDILLRAPVDVEENNYIEEMREEMFAPTLGVIEHYGLTVERIEDEQRELYNVVLEITNYKWIKRMRIVYVF